MSVPKSKRNKSNIQYLYSAVVFSENIHSILLKMPKEWTDIYFQSYVHSTDRLVDCLFTADAIKMKNDQDKFNKLLYLQKALGSLNVLETKINKILVEWADANSEWKTHLENVAQGLEKPNDVKKPIILNIAEGDFVFLGDLCVELREDMGEQIILVRKQMDKK